jgi:triacylglycerol esterase/lipase EstA (alpha/beta hydrolase family)
VAARRTFLRLAPAVAAAASLIALAASPAAATPSYPVAPNIVAGAAKAATDPAQAPPGANVAGCHSDEHPHPVILVNGTFANQEDDFGALAPTLANSGYCVYTFAYGAPAHSFIQSTGHVPASARELGAEVSRVLATTGAKKVDLIGHSQGGMLAEYYAKLLGGARHVDKIVGLSPSTHGTSLLGLTALAKALPGVNQLAASACPACTDQEAGSEVIKRLDSGAIAQPSVDYTVIETRNEAVVTPVGSSFIREPGVHNQYVQSSCPFDVVDHVDLPYDRVVFQLVENALDPASAQHPNCAQEFPYPA